MNEQVLVIDNEQDTVTNIVFSLRLRGISCRGETDPILAIEQFQASPTDVVIVDFHFPPRASYGEITGINIIERLQAIQPLTQFVLISGMISPQLDSEMLSDEMKTTLKTAIYIPKPTDLRLLVETVNQFLKVIEQNNTNWKATSQQYVAVREVSPEEVIKLNEEIKSHLIDAIDEPQEYGK